MPDTELTSAAVAARLSISPRQLAREVARGRFPHTRKHGTHTRAPFVFLESDVIAYEKRRAAEQAIAKD